MIDFFALLNQPRRPWLDPERLKEAFLVRSGEVHPDRATTDAERESANRDSSVLNEAHQTLRDPRLRLRHLLFLITGQPPSDIQSVPVHISDLFFRVGRVFQPVDELLRRRVEDISPMARVSHMQEALSRLAELRTLQGELEDVVGRLDARLRELDAVWSGPPSIATQLEELRNLYRDFSYVSKWLGQVREKSVQLML